MPTMKRKTTGHLGERPPYLKGWQDALEGRPHAFEPESEIDQRIYNAYTDGYTAGRQAYREQQVSLMSLSDNLDNPLGGM